MRRVIVVAVVSAAVLAGLWVCGNAEGARWPYRRSYDRSYNRGYSGYRHGYRGTRRTYVRKSDHSAAIRQSRQRTAKRTQEAAVQKRRTAAAAAERASHAAAVYEAETRLAELPATHTRLTYGGKSYYYVNGRYYVQAYSEGSVTYDAVKAPVGLVVTSIPSDANSAVLEGKTYYQAVDTVYTDTMKDGRPAYVVCDRASEEAAAQLTGEDEAPDPFDLLARMSDYIGAVDSYSVKGIAVAQGVLDSGQKVHFSGTRTVNVRRPDKLYAVASGDIINRSTWYDGKQISVLDSERNVYAQIDAPPTIDQALDFVAREYGHTMPLSDLFYSDIYESIAPNIESAVYLGLHKVGGVDCHHLALSGEAVDAELWIQEGDEPLIRKVAIVHKQDEDALSFVATLDWDLKATYTDDDFVFTVPEGAEQIEAKPVEQDVEEAEETE